VRSEFCLFAGLILLADQFTKALVVRGLAEGTSVRVALGAQIRHVANRGRNQLLFRSRTALLLLWVLALASIILVTQNGSLFQHPAAQAGLGAALGGAGSNLYDRLCRGRVIDFLAVGWWPVFNLADVAISLGAIAAIWFIR
jgi:signal peptidase II